MTNDHVAERLASLETKMDILTSSVSELKDGIVKTVEVQGVDLAIVKTHIVVMQNILRWVVAPIVCGIVVMVVKLLIKR